MKFKIQLAYDSKDLFYIGYSQPAPGYKTGPINFNMFYMINIPDRIQLESGCALSEIH